VEKERYLKSLEHLEGRVRRGIYVTVWRWEKGRWKVVPDLGSAARPQTIEAKPQKLETMKLYIPQIAGTWLVVPLNTLRGGYRISVLARVGEFHAFFFSFLSLCALP